MSTVKNIMIVGVGGQGTLLASRLIGRVVMDSGFDVKVSEVHGMSQRGGSVVTYVRYGEKVYSPIIDLGEADIIVSFEECEAARWLPFLKKNGRIITSSQHIAPMPVITGAAAYPEKIQDKITASGCNVTVVDALTLAEEAGSAKAANIVLMGVLSGIMDFNLEAWHNAIKNILPDKFHSMNLNAFNLGRKWIE